MRRRKNAYSGILRPVVPGRGAPEVSSLLIYDIENDRIRNQVANACLDYGLQRIQYSAFFGMLNRNRREELMLRIQRLAGEAAMKIRLIPLCQADVEDMWVFEQGGPEKEQGSRTDKKELPRLKVVAGTER